MWHHTPRQLKKYSANNPALPYIRLNTRKFATGSTLCQNCKPKLIVYVSKRLPEVARNYSITELEMCHWAINIVSFEDLLKRVDFDAILDHLPLTHIIKITARTNHS